MSHPADTEIRILAAAGGRFACDRPEHLLKHGDHTPLSQGLQDAVERLFAEAGAAMPPDGATVGVVGTSRFGELSTLTGITRKFRDEGIYGIDPVVFSKANQFYTLFAVGRRFRLLGPASSLFTSGSGSAEALYFADRLLRQVDATHVIALDYEEDGPPTAVPVQGQVRALLLGFGNGRAAGPALTACRLGPHLGTDGARAGTLAVFLDRQAAQGGRQLLLVGAEDADSAERAGLGGAMERLEAGRAVLPQLMDVLAGLGAARDGGSADEVRIHIVPPGRGNILSVCCRFHGPGREGVQ